MPLIENSQGDTHQGAFLLTNPKSQGCIYSLLCLLLCPRHNLAKEQSFLIMYKNTKPNKSAVTKVDYELFFLC